MKDLDSITGSLQQSREEGGDTNFEMKGFNAKKQNLASSREQFPQRMLVLQLMRPRSKFYANQFNSIQNVPSSNNYQQNIQTKINLPRTQSRVLEVG